MKTEAIDLYIYQDKGLFSCSPKERKQRISRIKRKMLEEGLKKYGITLEDVNVERNLYGKPFLVSSKKEVPYFNLSHSGEVVIMAFSKVPIGVDVEKLEKEEKKLEAHKNVAKRFLLDTEVRRIQQEEDEERQERAFIYLWNRLEAVCKRKGNTLGKEVEERKEEEQEGFFQSFELLPGYGVGISVEGKKKIKVSCSRVTV